MASEAFFELGSEDDAIDDVTEHLVVRVGELLLALPIQQTRQILDTVPLTPLPQAPPHTLGFAVLDEVPYAVVDLAGKLGYRVGGGASAKDWLVVLELTQSGSSDRVALKVDDVVAVANLDEASESAVPGCGDDWRHGAISGVARYLGSSVLVLDLARTFSQGNLAVAA